MSKPVHSRFARPSALASATALCCLLAACGGGSDDAAVDPANPPAPVQPATPTLTLTGRVTVNGPVRNVTVCLDLNANAACDTGEPVSAATGDDGVYAVTVDTAKVSADQVAAASLIAPMVAGASIDTASGTAPAASYVMRQVRGKAGAINPLTTLLATGMAAGMSEEVARVNLVTQLGLSSAAQIDDYLGEPTASPTLMSDTARRMAMLTAELLEKGGTLELADQSAARDPAPGSLLALNFTDPGNYNLRYQEIIGKAAGPGLTPLRDVRAGRSNSAALSESALYASAYLTAGGWVRCAADTSLAATAGNPNRSVFCGAVQLAGYDSAGRDLSGRGMAEVVTEMAAEGGTTINAGMDIGGLNNNLGPAAFPAGSRSTLRTTWTLNQSVWINSANTDRVAYRGVPVPTLENLVASFPASVVVTPDPAGTISLGLSTGLQRNLRVAFTGTHTTPLSTGTVQFYDCELNAAQTVASNCATLGPGTYSVEEQNGVRMLRVAGHPNTIMNHVRLFVEVQNTPAVSSTNAVFIARQNKPDAASNTSATRRINATAWAAMRQALGL
ncbi:MAG: hypothetical protein HZY78_05405 [Burkholderiaceae bacterium]|nr:MAG: hypothetical protein HZY78_05405 [Burkholderiaceae bacterium]